MADVSSLDVKLYVKRRPLLRLDVGPFAVAYGALHGAAWAAPSPPVAALVAIPVVLTLHLFVFLSTRWSVACSCVTLCMLLLFEATLCFQRLRSLEHLRAMRRPPRLVYALRLGAWRPCLSDDLVPGDVCSLAAPSRSRQARGGVGTGGATIPCDCLLLDGAAVVNEAMLTGESVPQRKEGAALADRDATGALAGALLVDTAHRRHVLFGGTDLIDATPGAPAPQPVVDDGATSTTTTCRWA
ncbi:calcium-transporting ATPase [Aureococcus anophagefferens]|nr:calcium-transporting ATPase [Aureococcus anophagefferens]